ncbi:MAG: DUF3792 family protein [Firmicutes bacterium]|nr:DUF3792 family protein [Bacillota bacterium]
MKLKSAIGSPLPALSFGGLGSLIFGVMLGLLLVVVLSLISTLIIYNSTLSESLYYNIAPAINGAAFLLAGIVAALGGSRGYLRGLAAGLLLMLFYIAVGGIPAPVQIAYSLLAAMTGGILGVR